MYFEKQKLFLRKLSQGKIKITDLCREYIVVSYIVKLAIQQYETCPKISSRSSRKMGKNRRQYSCERSVSEISSTEEYFTSEEEEIRQVKRVKNQQGLGKTLHLKQTLMFHFLTPEKRKKAMKLFEYLIRYKFFTLNSYGEIIQNGKNIHDSNILELIAHAVQNDSSTPIGMKYFYKMLKKKNIPEKYISNKMGRKIMNKSLYHETLKWRPARSFE